MMKKINIKGIKNISRKKKIIIIALLVLIVVVGIVIASTMRGDQGEEMSEMQFETAAVERMTIQNTVSSKGQIDSSLTEKITPRTSYRLEKIKVEQGEAIKEGDTILLYTNGGRLAAPYDCVVKSWDLPDPKKALTNSHYVELAGTDVLKLELSVDENQVLNLKKGDKANITVGATGGKYKGEVSFVSDIGDYSGGTSQFRAEVLFNNDGKIKLGMEGKAKVILERAENVLCVPADAVFDSGEASYVQIQDGEGTREKEVETGIRTKKYVEIKKGLKEGDQVIIMSDDEEMYY